MKMECLYLLVFMTICWLSVNADSSEEMVVMYRDGKFANNMRPQWKNSISNEYQTYVNPWNNRRYRHCTRIRNVCATNNMIYDNYCGFKTARSFEDISRVRCTEGHVRTFYVAATRPPPPVTKRPKTTIKTTKPRQRAQPEGENGRIDERVNVVPEPIPPTKNTVDILTTAEICAEVCPLIFEPVCATDGKDYPNVCVFDASKCEGNTDKSVTIDYYGLCEAPTPPTGDLEGFRYCPEDACEENINYVCGTDGITYDNKCKLLKVACVANNSSLDIEYEGKCTPLVMSVSPEQEPEQENNHTMEPLPTPKKSQMTTEDPCVKPTCKVTWEPVCADDGKTYPSRCVLENINRCSDVKLTLLHTGECVKSTTPSKCTTCPPLQLAPVCGTDDISYPSRCILQKYNCENSVEVEVAYEGECIIRGDI